MVPLIENLHFQETMSWFNTPFLTSAGI